MPRLSLLIAPIAILAATVPADAAPGGPLGTLLLGHYTCETGGDALGPTGIHQPERDFSITRGSSYRTDSGRGIYLLTGDRVTFTSGPMEGQAFRRVRENFLRVVATDGRDGELRCIRRRGL